MDNETLKKTYFRNQDWYSLGCLFYQISSTKSDEELTCPSCGTKARPIKKLHCYICSKCRVVLNLGSYRD